MDTQPAPQPWYHEGLRFTCTQCGDCCTGSEGYVWVDDEEIRAIAQAIGKDEGTVRVEHTRRLGMRISLKEFANGDCTLLDPETRKCRVYSVRPKQCRTWPFWNSNLESPRAWKETEKVCPGSGQGRLYQLEEIQAQAAIIDL
ncbi:MAG: YkgJ family cysteine cluster protein [Planctomycetota bacterium]|nr:YkgJ family cysteine cluster protein [Planctomycetota bacterium]